MFASVLCVCMPSTRHACKRYIDFYQTIKSCLDVLNNDAEIGSFTSPEDIFGRGQ